MSLYCLKLAGLQILLLSAGMVFAESGGATGVDRGGDPLRKIPANWNPFGESMNPYPSVAGNYYVAQNLMETILKPSLHAYLSSLDPDKAFSPKVAALLKKMLVEGLIEDLSSPYFITRRSLVVAENPVAAAAMFNDTLGPIFLNARYFEESQWGPMATWAITAGLAVHEHAWHLGIDDSDHSIFEAVAENFVDYLQSRECAFSPFLGHYYCGSTFYGP